MMDGAPEEIALAEEIIRQLEKLDYPHEINLKAMGHVCVDTKNKLPITAVVSIGNKS